MSWNLIGHSWVEKTLHFHLASQNLRHAYLFTGSEGIGRRTLALRFAQAINCTNPPTPGEFCGACRICRQIQAQQHADLFVIRPEEDSGIIRIDTIRQLQHSLYLKAYEAAYRIAVLLDFHKANAPAQNALLKTLEEAPGKVILLLTADSPESVLPTISSRCEIFRMRPLTLPQLSDALLSQNAGMTPADASTLAHLAEGRPGRALAFLNDPSLVEKHNEELQDLLALLPANRRERFAYCEMAAKEKAGVRSRLQTWLTFWRDCLMVSHGSLDHIINLGELETIRRIGGSIQPVLLQQVIGELTNAFQSLDANANTRLLLENLLLTWPRQEI